jgi:hypothetical protein
MSLPVSKARMCCPPHKLQEGPIEIALQVQAARLFVGVYIHAGLLDVYSYAGMRTRTHVHMVPCGRRADRGLKYLFVEDTGSGYFLSH